MRQAEKNYIRHFVPAMIAYGLVLGFSVFALNEWRAAIPLALRIALALAPAVPILFFCRAMIRYIRECDEMQRHIELESIALASVIVGMLFLCLGFLGSAKVITLNGAAVAIWVFPSLCGVYGLAKCLAARRYQ